MVRLRQFFFAACMSASVAFSTSASAQCAVPNTLANGQMADATEVMDNFDAVAACADDAAQNSVTHTGTPQTGEIAVFTGPASVTSGDLSGDISTSGSTTTTLAPTGVVPGSYTNSNITVDAKGRVTSANSGASGGGGASSYTKYVVANPGDSFIDVKLDTDDGYAYSVIIKGAPNVNAKLNFTVSSDDGASFYTGSSDYKYGSVGAASSINLVNGSTIRYGRVTIVDFTVAGMNVATNDRIALTGTVFTIASSIANINATIGGHNNDLGNNNFNAFRISVSSGHMDNFAVYVQRIY